MAAFVLNTGVCITHRSKGFTLPRVSLESENTLTLPPAESGGNSLF